MVPVDFLPGAHQDFDASYDWYAERSAQAAERFARAIEVALTRISRDPLVHGAIDEKHRVCAVRKFPFRIVFRSEHARVLVVAVAHAKRRPNYWQRRV